MRSFWFILVLVFLGLQYKLWLGDGNIHQWSDLEQKNIAQQQTNEKLRARNQALTAEIEDLRHGHEALEEKARNDLGMVKVDEKYYYLVE